MARPRKDPKMVKTHMTGAYLTADQYKTVAEAAALAGVPKAVYIRSRIVAAARADIQRLTQAADTRRV